MLLGALLWFSSEDLLGISTGIHSIISPKVPSGILLEFLLGSIVKFVRGFLLEFLLDASWCFLAILSFGYFCRSSFKYSPTVVPPGIIPGVPSRILVV